MQTRPAASSSPKGVARRQLIIETATRLIARNGSRGTTLAQIAHESGVSQPGLIYYFATKDELLNAALDERDGVEEAALWPADGEGLNFLETIVASVDAWQASPDAVGMHTVLVAENVGQDGALRPRLTERYTATVERFAALLVEAQKQGAVRRDVDVRNKAREIIAFINGLETAWLLNPDIPAGTIAAQWAADQRRALAP
jgi:AcrR family transcriptional regulator